MPDLLFVTTNEDKFKLAELICWPLGITLKQENMELIELQTNNGEDIARHKAEQAFEHFRCPVVVNDDSWDIPGLGGFPGPYMKYINKWLTGNDLIRLTAHLEDRRIILNQITVYQDADEQRLFRKDITGELLTRPVGSGRIPHFSITSFDGGQHSAEEIRDSGRSALASIANVWQDFASWYMAKNLAD